jgi:beta-lactam-binding protein with PASTA domain
MPATLTVSSPAETHSVALDASGKGEATFILTNSSSRSIQGRATVVAQDPARPEWFRIVGSQERSFRGGEAQQFKVEVSVPPATPAGKYGFRLDGVNVANPDEDFAEGQVMSIEWKPVAMAPPPARPSWIIPASIAAGVIALALAIGLPLTLRDRTVDVPNVVGKSRADAESDLKAAGFELAQTPTFGFDSNQGLDAVLELSALEDGKPAKLEAGKPLRKGAEVVLTLNRYAVVPAEVIGKKREVAEELLTKAQLRVSKEANFVDDPTRDPTLVRDTEPKPGVKTEVDSEIVLVFSGSATVPNLEGKDSKKAAELLNDAGLKVSQTPRFEFEPNRDLDVVLKMLDGKQQWLRPGQRVSKGTEVTLTLNRFNVIPPEIIGMDVDQALGELKRRGIAVDKVDRKPEPEKRENTVIRVEPPPSQKFRPDQKVRIRANEIGGAITIMNQADFPITFDATMELVPLQGSRADLTAKERPFSRGQSRSIRIPFDIRRVLLRIRIAEGTEPFKVIDQKDFRRPETKRFKVEGPASKPVVSEEPSP